MNRPQKQILIGCQGWNYADWTTKAGAEPVFYPRGTKSGEMLPVYARSFETIEVDSTVYGIPKSTTLEGWYEKTPAAFRFSLKMPREVTHEGALRDTTFAVLEEFCERSKLLKEKLASILIQLPPAFEATKENAQALRLFLDRLPVDINFAVEFRDSQWLVDWTFEELEKANAALCLTHGKWIQNERMFDAGNKVRNKLAYVRFMGERDLTTFDRVVRPQDENLALWKKQIESLDAEQILVYFSNFYEGFAPASSNRLRQMLGQETVKAAELEDQGSLF
jgi:uncharacterized protein YecE (DUF72 family)